MDLLSAISISALGSMESFDPFSHNHGSVEKTGCVFEGNDPVGDFSRFFTKKNMILVCERLFLIEFFHFESFCHFFHVLFLC